MTLDLTHLRMLAESMQSSVTVAPAELKALLVERDELDKIQREQAERWQAEHDRLAAQVAQYEAVVPLALRDGMLKVGEELTRRAQQLTALRAFGEQRRFCHLTYNGGHHDDPAALKAFHHGMDTAFNVFEAFADKVCP